jgi:diacylglycerol kinase
MEVFDKALKDSPTLPPFFGRSATGAPGVGSSSQVDLPPAPPDKKTTHRRRSLSAPSSGGGNGHIALPGRFDGAVGKTPEALRALVRDRFQAQSFGESLSFALQGLCYALKTQRNVRIDVCLAVATIALGWICQLNVHEWLPLILSMGLVLCAETMNTALEFTVDLVTQGEFDMRAKVIKDLAAGACLICAAMSAAVGGIIFIPYALRWLVALGF